MLDSAFYNIGVHRLMRFCQTYEKVLVLLILVLGFGLRFYAAASWNAYQPASSARLVGDESQYDNLARSVWHGYGFDWPGRTPLYPLWLAAVYWLTDGSYIAIPYAQIALGLLTIWLSFHLAKTLFGVMVGLLAALLSACSYTLIHQSLHLLTEIMFAPALLIVALTFWQAFQKPSLRRFMWLGFWIGISNLIRPTLMLFPFFILLILVIFHRQRMFRLWAVCFLTATLVITPWIVHNYVRHNSFFILLAPSNAILWQGSPEYYHLLRDQKYSYIRVWSEIIYGPHWREHDPMSVHGDQWWTQRALRSIMGEPQIYLLYASEKLATYWIGDPEADWNASHAFDYNALREIGFSSRDAKLVMIMRSIPIFALLAALILYRSTGKLIPIYGLLLFCTLLHAATHAEVRLSEPLQPILLILISAACIGVHSRIPEPPSAAV